MSNWPVEKKFREEFQQFLEKYKATVYAVKKGQFVVVSPDFDIAFYEPTGVVPSKEKDPELHQWVDEDVLPHKKKITLDVEVTPVVPQIRKRK